MYLTIKLILKNSIIRSPNGWMACSKLQKIVLLDWFSSIIQNPGAAIDNVRTHWSQIQLPRAAIDNVRRQLPKLQLPRAAIDNVRRQWPKLQLPRAATDNNTLATNTAAWGCNRQCEKTMTTKMQLPKIAVDRQCEDTIIKNAAA